MNRTSKYAFTIIVPVYNEVENMTKLEKTLSDFLPESLLKSCVLLVDDGSTDGSLERIREICSRHEDFFFISFRKNAGLSAAIGAGFDHSFSEYVGYIDADLQTLPQDFNLLLRHAGECSMVTGVRTGRKDPFSKRVQSRIANGFRRMVTRDGALDTGCPLKVLRADVAKSLPSFDGMHRFLPALVLRSGGTYKQVSVRHFPREAGESKFSLRNRFWKPLVDCFTLGRKKSLQNAYIVAETNL